MENKRKLNHKGIWSFLLITFLITYSIEGALILSGFRITSIPAYYGQLIIAGVMWVPALAVLITVKFITKEGFAGTFITFGSWKPYLFTALIIPACFVLIYGLTWLVGLGKPDWDLEQFYTLMASSSGKTLGTMPSPKLILPAIFFATLVTSPFINAVFGFGEELGWRGYLLPKLMTLGKFKAYLILGFIWGLWHLPLILIGFTYPGHPFTGFLVFVCLTTAFGIFLNELTLHYKSSVLAGWVHGLFNSQKLGVWALLFPAVNPLIGGYAGVTGIFIWLLLGLVTIRWVNGRNAVRKN